MPEIQPDSRQQDYDEEQLLRAARDGDSQAFGRIYETYAERVFRYLFSHLDDRLDAEDLTEEVFLRAWQALPAFRPRGVPFRAYLFRIAHNALVDHYRHARRQQPELNLDDHPVSDIHPDPEQTFQAGLESQHLRSLLGQLRQDYRTVLSLRFLAELSPGETARVMGRSAGAVRILQHRALQALRKLMDTASDRSK